MIPFLSTRYTLYAWYMQQQTTTATTNHVAVTNENFIVFGICSLVRRLRMDFTYFGAGSPSASHSIKNGLSFSLDWTATWYSSSSVGGCLIIRGGEWTILFEKQNENPN